MQPAVRIRNKSTPWNPKLRPRVGDTVISGGIYYSNICGYNGSVADITIWLAFGNSGSSAVEINKTASDITGTEPFYQISLSDDPVPSFPGSFSIYIDLLNDGGWKMLSPVDYDPAAKLLSGMNSPTDFPDQKIKIFVS